MQDVLPGGGVVRKLWVGEVAKYRDHVLRLDPDSRRSRFGGAVSDYFVRNYVDLSFSLDAVVHAFEGQPMELVRTPRGACSRAAFASSWARSGAWSGRRATASSSRRPRSCAGAAPR